MRKLDITTRRWIKNESDEKAVANGCWFSEARGQFVVDFFSRTLRFYEGEFAGLPFIPLDWQADVLMRAFGWVRYSDHWKKNVRRFRTVSLWAPKKSGKSPFAAGVTCYLSYADGERGQKVFIAARDKNQATIIFRHTLKMVRAAESLRVLSRIRESEQSIEIPSTDSIIQVIAGDNIESQEGLNGSVVIDELHVVDERLAETLENADSSRSQAMRFEISTAGVKDQGYGWKEYEYGKSVERGDMPDDSFLPIFFEAPQNASDHELETNENIWAKSNPSWGVTIDRNEFKNKLVRAKRSPSSWSRFKRYRLNIWTASDNPYIPMDAWHGKCKEEFTEQDLSGRPCWIGMDLARTLDMAAVVLAFPDEAESADSLVVRLLPFFWYPENRAIDQAHLAPFMEWSQAGFLNLSPGDTIEFGPIFDTVSRLSKLFNVNGVFYDRTYANELTERFVSELGIERTEFAQTVYNFAGPTASLVRMITRGMVRHNGHPVLSWQAGNATASAADRNGNERVVKPKDKNKKVDGIVASVMALAGCLSGINTSRSYYEDHELEAI